MTVLPATKSSCDGDGMYVIPNYHGTQNEQGTSREIDLKHLRENRMERGLLRVVRDSLQHSGRGLEGGRRRRQLGQVREG